MNKYLYLKMLRRATSLALLLFALPLLGQYSSARRSQPRMTPRALAVLELDAKGGARLYPVMLMLEGKIYDASLYGSRPVPMALFSDTVYEAQKAGMPLGLFTVDFARRLQSQWWGEGKWKPFASEEKKDTKGDSKSATAKADNKPALKDDDDPDRPVLKKPKTDSTPAEAPTPAPTGEKKTVPSETTNKSVTSSPDDPDRPVLRRGMPIGTSQVREQPFEELTPARAKEVAVARGPVQSFAAISDATPSDNRPFDMQLGPEEQEKYGKELARLAWIELRKFAGTSIALPAEPAFTNVSIHSYDIDYSNNPVLVYSAEYRPGAATVMPRPRKTATKSQPAEVPPAKPMTYSVTFVGKVDLQGKVNKMFASATDTGHLDVYPRLEIIDAVDADGDGRAELLFRQVSDIGHTYVVYRASPYWSQLFEGAGSR